ARQPHIDDLSSQAGGERTESAVGLSPEDRHEPAGTACVRQSFTVRRVDNESADVRSILLDLDRARESVRNIEPRVTRRRSCLRIRNADSGGSETLDGFGRVAPSK